MYAIVSAIISAAVSFITCFFTLYIHRKHEEREAHRTLLLKDIPSLSSNLYSLLASLKIYQDKFMKQGEINDFSRRWLDKIERVKTDIIEMRLRLRYPFNNTLINELKTYTILTISAMAYVDNKELFDDYFGYMDKLREALDNAIWDSYKTGRPPSEENISIVQKHIKKIKVFQEKTNKNCLLEKPIADELSVEDLIKSLRSDV